MRSGKPGTRNGETGRPWRDFEPTARGRHWAYPPSELDRLDAEDGIYWPVNGGWPRQKRYLDQAKGVPIQDVWTDITPLNSQARERMGYPTQKPLALLERIITASSGPGDTVLDPFCGCGTAVEAAGHLGRRWIGIDVTHLAINLIKNRVKDALGADTPYRVIGEPVTVPDAVVLAGADPYQFQFWALGLVGARPAEEKKGADRGIDGRLYFHDGSAGTTTKQVIFSVKAGQTGPAHVRDLHGVVDRERAAMGVLITLRDPTPEMRTAAAAAGVYRSDWGASYPRLQVLTVAELLAGRTVAMPPIRQVNATFRKAPPAGETATTLPLPLGPAPSLLPPPPEFLRARGQKRRAQAQQDALQPSDRRRSGAPA